MVKIMLATELIKKLQELVDAHGNVPVYFSNGYVEEEIEIVEYRTYEILEDDIRLG